MTEFSNIVFRSFGLTPPVAGRSVPASQDPELEQRIDGNIDSNNDGEINEGDRNGFIEAEELFEEVFSNRARNQVIIEKLHTAAQLFSLNEHASNAKGSRKANAPLSDSYLFQEAMREMLEQSGQGSEESNRLRMGQLSDNEQRLERTRQAIRRIEQREAEVNVELEGLIRHRQRINREVQDWIIQLLQQPHRYCEIRQQLFRLEARDRALQQRLGQLIEEGVTLMQERHGLQIEEGEIEDEIREQELTREIFDITMERLTINRRACGCTTADVAQTSNPGFLNIVLGWLTG